MRVKFMCYDQTLQAACLQLMGKKLLVALTMEGKFAGEGLQTMDEDDDMLSAMARELVEKNGIGETADNVWRALTREHQKMFSASSNVSQLPGEVVEAPSMLSLESAPARLIEDAINTEQVLIFGQRPEALRSRRRQRAVIPEQTSLFGLTP